ncbi:MAG: inorganic pyrophosphatase [Candidatus Colwellbacteria bacterium CG10_big_fil_rev_8_21_14_0_10_41_28]|uniref:Inorganic pyrophosphatase n=1 Tax=Candidatus Colwellbacteria bacterium CG10_big_fil_rev_8_21_14_0_10_41_28 TaxID=1974539 RepID=A0A2H0VJ85_9BACT|nr:MAG: inorganic pyrophosphatase [Candidatus Colwellbacteria bacterium CG10_big_fil_rev_8_21_14_0_10_41_28]
MKVDVVVEIPKGSRNKYEFDEETGDIRLDRVLRSAVHYPGDYGEVPNTLGEDGDPLDAIIINRFPVFPGCVVPVRILGVLEMIDSGDNDEKLVGVPEGDPEFADWKDLNDVPLSTRDEIKEFFSSYKNLERGKEVQVKEWLGVDKAEEILKKAQEAYKAKNG